MFFTRLFSGIVLVAIALFTLISGGGILAGILLVISLIAYMELSKAMGVYGEQKKFNALELAGLLGIIAYYVVVYVFSNDMMHIMMLTAMFMAFMFVYVVTFPKFHINQIVSAFFAFVYAPVMLSFIYMTRELNYGNYIVWLIVISSWGSDTCAYAVGMAFGKTIGNHKIFPKLSPKKSLEGCIGGVVGAAIIGGLYGHFLLESVVADQTVTYLVMGICAIGAIFSQMGDLAASAIKRNHNIKDYGKLIPGHGGIMDRFDSMIVTAPLIYFLIRMLISGVIK